jgi:hypothetical protein
VGSNTVPGFLWLPKAALTVGAVAAGILFTVAPGLGFGLSLMLAMIALLSVAAALFLTIPELPKERPALRRVAAVILAAGGAMVLMMTPFGAMALVALASR